MLPEIRSTIGREAKEAKPVTDQNPHAPLDHLRLRMQTGEARSDRVKDSSQQGPDENGERSAGLTEKKDPPQEEEPKSGLKNLYSKVTKFLQSPLGWVTMDVAGNVSNAVNEIGNNYMTAAGELAHLENGGNGGGGGGGMPPFMGGSGDDKKKEKDKDGPEKKAGPKREPAVTYETGSSGRERESRAGDGLKDTSNEGKEQEIRRAAISTLRKGMERRPSKINDLPPEPYENQPLRGGALPIEGKA